MDLDFSEAPGLAFELKLESSDLFFDLAAAFLGEVFVNFGIKRTTVGAFAPDLPAELDDPFLGRSCTMTGLRAATGSVLTIAKAACCFDVLDFDKELAFLLILIGGTLSPVKIRWL